MKRSGAGWLVLALALLFGACGQGPTLELGDDERADAGAGGGGREDDDDDDSGGSPGSGYADGGAVSRDSGADDEEDGAEPEGDTESEPACTTDADCTEAERPNCNGERCVECTTDEHCAGSEQPVCVVAEGHCE